MFNYLDLEHPFLFAHFIPLFIYNFLYNLFNCLLINFIYIFTILVYAAVQARGEHYFKVFQGPLNDFIRTSL